MSTERAEGIVLRTWPVTETSLLVTWFTRQCGRLKTLAKGARRLKSSMHGKLDLFYGAEIVFRRSQRSDLHLLNDVYLESARRDIRQSVEQVAAAAAVCEVVDELLPAEDPHESLFDELQVVLDEFAQQANWTLVVWWELRVLQTAGWKPQWTEADGVARVLQSLGIATVAGAKRVRLTPQQLEAAAGRVERFLEANTGRRLRSQGVPWRKLQR